MKKYTKIYLNELWLAVQGKNKETLGFNLSSKWFSIFFAAFSIFVWTVFILQISVLLISLLTGEPVRNVSDVIDTTFNVFIYVLLWYNSYRASETISLKNHLKDEFFDMRKELQENYDAAAKELITFLRKIQESEIMDDPYHKVMADEVGEKMKSFLYPHDKTDNHKNE